MPKQKRKRIREDARPKRARREKAHRLEEAIYCYRAKLAGYDYETIAKMASTHFNIGMSRATANRRVLEELRRRRDEDLGPVVEELRNIEVSRLDAQLRRLVKLVSPATFDTEGRVITDDDGKPRLNDPQVMLRAEATMVRNFQRRAALLGLDAPLKVEATVETIDETDKELRALLAEAAVADSLRDQKEDTHAEDHSS